MKKQQRMSNAKAMRKLLDVEMLFTGVLDPGKANREDVEGSLFYRTYKQGLSANHLARCAAESGNAALIVGVERIRSAVAELVGVTTGHEPNQEIIALGREGLIETKRIIGGIN